MADQLSVLAIEDIVVGAGYLYNLYQISTTIDSQQLRQEQSDDTRTSSAKEDTTLLVKMFIELKQDINALKKIIGHTDTSAFQRGFTPRQPHLCAE